MNAPQEKGTPVFHNLVTSHNNLTQICNEFMRNSGHIKTRSNGIILHHEIISLSSLDKELATEHILNSIARKYLELRASEAKAYAVAQFNTENPHIHLMISANKLDSAEKMEVSNKEFFSIRREMDKYLEQTYPELKHSIVFTDKDLKKKKTIRSDGKMKVSWYEQEREKRLKRAGKEVTPSKKQMVRDTILTAFSVAMDSSQFVNLLKEQGLILYKRGQSFGVENSEGMKFRLHTLALEQTLQQSFQQWAAMPKRLEQELAIELEKLQQKISNLGFREDIKLALQQQPPNELDLILKEQRQKKRNRTLSRTRSL